MSKRSDELRRIIAQTEQQEPLDPTAKLAVKTIIEQESAKLLQSMEEEIDSLISEVENMPV